MNPEKIYVEVPGELGWRVLPLRELVELWRERKISSSARYQAADGQWRPLTELITAVGASQPRPSTDKPGPDDARKSSPPRKLRRPMWTGLALVLALVSGGLLWILLRESLSSRRTEARAEREVEAWEQGLRSEGLVKSGVVEPGMTPEQVRRAVGPPRQVRATGDASLERWVYRHQIVVFVHGRVTEVLPQTSAPE